MKTRVAVASSDGKYVNQHFGRATQFLIFEMGHDQDREDNDNPMDPGDHCEYRFIELRRNEPSCPGEDLEENKHLHVVRLLQDCQAVLVSRIGTGAMEILQENGIEPYVIPDYIEDALKRFVQLKRSS